MTTLTNSMQAAWAQKAQREQSFLAHAATAPALFKPEAVRAAGERFKRARGFLRMWS